MRVDQAALEAEADEQNDDQHDEEREDVAHRSETVRPMSTADWYIGSDRSRSMNPLDMSSAMPMPVKAEPNTTVWAKMPGTRNCS
jgi:hypothetical protein